MALPLVMCANNPKTASELEVEFPGRMGVLLTPGHWKDPGELPFVLDNGRFSAYSSGAKWSAKKYREFLETAKEFERDPLWIVVPDVVRDGNGTLREWKLWYNRLKQYGWKLALAVQQGITVDIVKGLEHQPDVIFVGGGPTRWKWDTAGGWCRNFDRVHIGAVGTERRLWMAHRVGAESTDSNVWRPVGRHLIGLRRYLERSGKGLEETEQSGFGMI